MSNELTAIYLTRLVRLDVPSGSQIRMDMYLKSKTQAAQYFFQQDVQSTIQSNIDLLDIDFTDGRFPNAKDHVKQIGDNKTAYATNNILDVHQFSDKSHVTKARLTFSKAANGFRVALYTKVAHDWMVCSWAMKGKIDPGYYSGWINGKLIMVDGLPAWLIDI